MSNAGPSTTRQCNLPSCGKEYSALNRELKRGKGLFCSPACGNQSRKKPTMTTAIEEPTSVMESDVQFRDEHRETVRTTPLSSEEESLMEESNPQNHGFGSRLNEHGVLIPVHVGPCQSYGIDGLHETDDASMIFSDTEGKQIEDIQPDGEIRIEDMKMTIEGENAGLPLTEEITSVTARRCKYTPVSVDIDPETTLEEWNQIYGIHHILAQKSNWYLGDTINAGARLFPDKYEQAILETGLGRHSLTNIAATCANIPPAMRKDGLSFSAHAAAAYVPPEKLAEVLDLAEKKGATVSEVQKMAKAIKTNGNGNNHTPTEPVEGETAPAVVEVETTPPLTGSQVAEATSEVASKLKGDFAEGERRVLGVAEWLNAQDISKWSAAKKKKVIAWFFELTTSIEKLAGADATFKAAFTKVGHVE